MSMENFSTKGQVYLRNHGHLINHQVATRLLKGDQEDTLDTTTVKR